MTPRIGGSYVWLHPARHSTRTVHVRPDLLVDLLPDGRIAGVERVGAPVTAEALAAVLAALPFDPPAGHPGTREEHPDDR